MVQFRVGGTRGNRKDAKNAEDRDPCPLRDLCAFAVNVFVDQREIDPNVIREILHG